MEHARRSHLSGLIARADSWPVLALCLVVGLPLSGCVSLVVTSTPPGADVTINGRLAGRTPSSTSFGMGYLFAGMDIRVTKQGFQPVADHIGLMETWFWTWGTAKTRDYKLVPSAVLLPLPSKAEPAPTAPPASRAPVGTTSR